MTPLVIECIILLNCTLLYFLIEVEDSNFAIQNKLDRGSELVLSYGSVMYKHSLATNTLKNLINFVTLPFSEGSQMFAIFLHF